MTERGETRSGWMARMSGTRRIVGLIAVVAWSSVEARASGPGATRAAPRLVQLDPPGLTAGRVESWTLTGDNLDGVERFLISGAGVDVVAIDLIGPGSLGVTVRAASDATPGFRAIRAVGPGGVSNLRTFRVDDLPQSRESEPNDRPGRANALGWNSAAAGILAPRDLDYYEFSGRAGDPVAIEVEARRLGAPMFPVVRLLTPTGASLALSRPLRDGTRDSRLVSVLPMDGRYRIEVREALYRGGAPASYRVRVGDWPFATGMYPLGGRRGATITLEANGGNLAVPLRKTLRLPDEPGTVVEPGPFAGQGHTVFAPGRIAIGDGPEVDEPEERVGESTVGLPFGGTANGRIGRPGEVDTYSIGARAGDLIRVGVRAAELGSWLDPVLTVFDSNGSRIAENDDRDEPNPREVASGIVAERRDSRLEVAAPEVGDGRLVVAVTDRFGAGGPEYAYRLSVGPPRDDFAIALRLEGEPSGSSTPPSGAFNLSPGTIATVRFRIVAEGRPGPIQVRAQGLPPGVTAGSATVRAARSGRADDPTKSTAAEGTLVLTADPDARPASGWMRVVARAPNAATAPIERVATTTLVLGAPSGDDPRPAPTWTVTELPVRVLPAVR
jgi:hypothetical protein